MKTAHVSISATLMFLGSSLYAQVIPYALKSFQRKYQVLFVVSARMATQSISSVRTR